MADENFFYDLGMSTVSSSWLTMQNRRCEKTQKERFHAFFGASPYVCSLVWSYLVQANVALDDYCQPKHLLWTLLFLKTYSTESVLAVLIGVDEKTVRKWVWYLIEELGDLYDDLVSRIISLRAYCLRLICISHNHCQRSNGRIVSWDTEAAHV